MGANLIAPAVAHVGGTINHLWSAPGHIRAKVRAYGDARWVRKPATHTSQAYTLGNLPLSNSAASPTTITSLTLPGPGQYLVTAAGMAWSDVNNDRAGIEIARNGTAISSFFNQIGLNTNNQPANYAITRLVSVSGASATIVVRGWRDQGTGTINVFENSLTATRVASGSGAQRALTARSSGTVGAP
jgi:hypothetical protein